MSANQIVAAYDRDMEYEALCAYDRDHLHKRARHSNHLPKNVHGRSMARTFTVMKRHTKMYKKKEYQKQIIADMAEFM